MKYIDLIRFLYFNYEDEKKKKRKLNALSWIRFDKYGDRNSISD